MLVFVGVLGQGAASLTPEADAAAVTVDVPEGVGDWVVHEETGRVFAALKDGDEVVEYGPSGSEVRRFKVGAMPTEMILKGDRLVVACNKSTSLYVVDLATNESLGAVEVHGKGPYGLFCSQVDNAYVYCICNTGDAWWDGEVFQVDLKAMKVRKTAKVQRWGQSHVLHVAMSRDGRWIVPDSRGATSPSGADLMKVDEEEMTFTQIRDYHDSFGQMVAGPFNRYWTFGNMLYTLDIRKSVRKFAGSPVAIHPRLDLAASKSNGRVMLERFSDASPIATIPLEALPADKKRSSGDRSGNRSSGALDPTLQFDLKNGLVFLGDRYHGYWIDLGEFEDKLSPLMIVQASSEVTSLVGVPLRIPLGVSNGGNTTTLAIEQGPEGAKLENGALVWHPQAENVGFTTVQLALKSTEDDRRLDTVDMTIQVTLPKLDLGFDARAMELSSGGRFLVVWGETAGQQNPGPVPGGSDEVAVIDLQELKTLARKTLPQGVRCATIDDDHVYISPNSGNLFYRLDRSLGQSQPMFLQSAPKQLVRIGKDRLLAVGQQLQFFTTDPLKVVPGLFEGASVEPGQTLRVLGQNEVQLGSQVLDRATGDLVGITGTTQLPSLARATGRAGFSSMNRDRAPICWGRWLGGNMLTNRQGNRVCQWPGERIGVLSERWPMAILVNSVYQQGTTTTTLELANLVDGLVAHTAIIDVSPNTGRSGSSGHYGERKTLLTTGGKVLLLKGTELLVATIPQKVAGAMPMPTYFPQQYAEVDAGEPTKLKLAVKGNTDGVTYSLLAEYPGVALDSDTGELAIDTPMLWDSYVKQAPVESHAPRIRSRNQPSAMSPEENGRQYRALTGKELPADKLAAQLPISAVLQDRNGQQDSIEFRVIVLGSRKSLDDAIAAKNAEIKERLAAAQEAKKAQEEARAREAEMQKEAEGDKSVTERLDELEARLRRLEAALDSILKRLEEK